MALPAHDDYSYDSDFSSDVSTAVASTAVKEAARPSHKTSTRRRPSSRRAPHSNRLTQRKPSISNAQPQTQDDEIAHSYREVLEEAREDGAVAIVPRRLRQGHRAFRMTWTAACVLTVLFAQLLGVLWLKSLAVSASHRTTALTQKIANAESQIDKTQRKIAVLGNSPQMATWAAKLGYRPMQQSDWDDITKPAAPIEYSNANTPAANNAKPRRP